MRTRKLLLASLLAATTAGVAGVAPAAVNFDVVLAPPAPRVEVVPAPRPGYVWAPGYWGYDNRHYVWHGGTWQHARPGEHWVAHNWEQHGDRWHLNQGHWARN